MKVSYAARFASATFLLAGLYTGWRMWPGLYRVNELSIRQSWIVSHTTDWSLGGWLWLLSLFSWMVLLVTVVWNYLPAHRVAGMLQSGLMVISAVLAIAGITVWMNVLPVAFVQSAINPAETDNSLSLLVDALALALLGSGCFMGGATTSWIAYDLLRQKTLARSWQIFPFISGICLILASFLQFHLYLLLTSLLCWLIWCIWFSLQRELPSPFSTWPDA